jgi:molecular chaperone DnaK (HSP70)
MGAYQSMLKRSGIPHLLVVKESRAALLNVIESGGVTPEELRSTILVVDLGSSTADFTVVTGGTSEAPMDFGQSLGASLIDGEILTLTLERHLQRSELQHIFQADPSARDRCQIRCRKAKEEYFSNENLYRDNDRQVAASFETLDGGVLFVPHVTGRIMNQILNASLPVPGGCSWIEMFRRLLTESQTQMREKRLSPRVIVVTGGASRMGFVRPICEEVFPDSKFRRDDEPEVSIARGLARWGRVYLRTADFEREVDAIADVRIPEIVLERRDALLKELSANLCNGLVDTAVRPPCSIGAVGRSRHSMAWGPVSRRERSGGLPA